MANRTDEIREIAAGLQATIDALRDTVDTLAARCDDLAKHQASLEKRVDGLRWFWLLRFFRRHAPDCLTVRKFLPPIEKGCNSVSETQMDATLSTSFWFEADEDEDRAEGAEAGVFFIGPDLMTITIPDVSHGDSMVICFDPRDLRRLLDEHGAA